MDSQTTHSATQTSSATLSQKRKAFLVTSYMSGSHRGHNLGTPGYSYDFLAQLLRSTIEQNGDFISIADPRLLEDAAQQARNRGLDPIHLSFLPFQHLQLSRSIPNVVMPAWEFPDIPDHEFDNLPQNNWTKVANDCQMILVAGDFTHDALRRGGVTAPICKINTPAAAPYFELSPWRQNQEVVVPCRAFWPANYNAQRWVGYETRRTCLHDSKTYFMEALENFSKCIVGPAKHDAMAAAVSKWGIERRKRAAERSLTPDSMKLIFPSTPELRLSGIVYTSIFNPEDGRKNWVDMLSGFLHAVGDKEDATLVIKLVTRNKEAVEKLVRFYQEREYPHQCKIAFIVDYLSDDAMLKLCQGTTYYLQTTKAEGICLPLLNHLAAARPAISPCHSAIGDYFDESMGWVIDSSQEPAAWPHDSRWRLRSSWARIHWPSCYEGIRNSYALAKDNYADYAELAATSRTKMHAWGGLETVNAAFKSAMEELDRIRQHPPNLQEPRLFKFEEAKASRSRKMVV